MKGRVVEYENEHGQKKILRIMGKIGKGGFGVVYKAVLDGFGEVAAKFQEEISRSASKAALLELKKAPELEKHSLVLRKIIVEPGLKATYFVEDNPGVAVTNSDIGDNVVVFIYDLAVGLDLSTLISMSIRSRVKFTADIIKIYASQLLKGVIEMRKAGVIHRDIKPENVMLHNGHLKYIDYGMICEPIGENKCEGVRGTRFFISPGVYEEEFGDITEKDWYDGDLYAVGITILNLMGNTPFESFGGPGDEDPYEFFEENSKEKSYELIQERIKTILTENNQMRFFPVVSGLTKLDPITPERALEMLDEI